MWLLLMALSVVSGSFNIGLGAAGTTVTITPGFETKALILWWNGRTEAVDAGGGATHLRGMGFATGAASFRAWSTRDQDAGGSAICDHAYRTDACILEISATAMVGWADVQSITATDVVFEILDAFVTNLRVFYLALGGDDITGAEIGDFTPTGTAPVNQTVNTTNVGKAIFFGGTRAMAANTQGAHSASFFGAATGPSSAYVWGGGATDGAGIGGTDAYCRSGECITSVDSVGLAGNLHMRAEFVSFNSGTPGFTINWLKRTTAYIVHYLLLAGTFEIALGDFMTLTTTGTITETGLPFEPAALLFASACRAESTAGSSSINDEFSLGAVSGAGQFNAQSSSRDGNTNMFVQTFVDYNSVYTNVAVATDLVEGQATLTSGTADGFTVDMNDADPVASFVWYVAFASAPSSGPPNWIPQRTSPGTFARLRR